MSSNVSPDKMRATGIVLSWLAGSAVVAMIAFLIAFIRSNTTRGNHPYGPLAHLVDSLGTNLIFVIPALEGVALAIFVMGVVRWPSHIIRSPRWMFSALGIVVVAAAIMVVIYLAVVIGVSNV